MSNLNSNNLSFGFGALAVIDRNNDVVGFSALTGSLTANISGELMPVVGGAASLPVEAAKGRSDGALTLNLNERPSWVDVIVNGATEADVSTNDYDLSDIRGDVSGKLTVAAKASSTPVNGSYVVRVTGTDTAEITHVHGAGVNTYSLTGLSTTATDIGSTNLTLALAAAGSLTADDEGSSAVVFITNAGGKAKSYSLPFNQATKYVRLVAMSATGGGGQDVRIHDFAKVALTGAPVMATDNENFTTEITGIVLEPGGTTPAYKMTVTK